MGVGDDQRRAGHEARAFLHTAAGGALDLHDGSGGPSGGGPDLQHDLHTAPVTTSAGRLVGLLLREDAERALHEWHEAQPAAPV